MPHVKEFLTNESGIETIEFLGLLIVALVLLGVIIALAKGSKETAKQTQGVLEDAIGKSP